MDVCRRCGRRPAVGGWCDGVPSGSRTPERLRTALGTPPPAPSSPARAAVPRPCPAARSAATAGAGSRSREPASWEPDRVLFALRFADPIARGEVDLTFRRWRRAQVRPGRPYRTPVGRLRVDEVDVVRPEDLAPDDARRAGFPSVAGLLAEADRHAAPDAELYRVRFHPLDEPDARSELAATVPGDDDLAVVR